MQKYSKILQLKTSKNLKFKKFIFRDEKAGATGNLEGAVEGGTGAGGGETAGTFFLIFHVFCDVFN